jgi:hypothetical protein
MPTSKTKIAKGAGAPVKVESPAASAAGSRTSKVKLALITSMTTVAVALIAILPRLLPAEGSTQPVGGGDGGALVMPKDPPAPPVVQPVESPPSPTPTPIAGDSIVGDRNTQVTGDDNITHGGTGDIHVGETPRDRDRRELEDKQSALERNLDHVISLAQQAGFAPEADELNRLLQEVETLVQQLSRESALGAIDDAAAYGSALRTLIAAKADLDMARGRAVEAAASQKAPDLWNEAEAANAEGTKSRQMMDLKGAADGWARATASYGSAGQAASLIDLSHENEAVIGVVLTGNDLVKTLPLQKKASRVAAERRLVAILRHREPSITPDRIEAARNDAEFVELSDGAAVNTAQLDVWKWRFRLNER